MFLAVCSCLVALKVIFPLHMGSLIFGELRVSQGGRQPSTDINLAWETNKDINVQICFTKLNVFLRGQKAF